MPKRWTEEKIEELEETISDLRSDNDRLESDAYWREDALFDDSEWWQVCDKFGSKLAEHGVNLVQIFTLDGQMELEEKYSDNILNKSYAETRYRDQYERSNTGDEDCDKEPDGEEGYEPDWEENGGHGGYNVPTESGAGED
jgi:hypothetical protein